MKQILILFCFLLCSSLCFAEFSPDLSAPYVSSSETAERVTISGTATIDGLPLPAGYRADILVNTNFAVASSVSCSDVSPDYSVSLAPDFYWAYATFYNAADELLGYATCDKKPIEKGTFRYIDIEQIWNFDLVTGSTAFTGASYSAATNRLTITGSGFGEKTNYMSFGGYITNSSTFVDSWLDTSIVLKKIGVGPADAFSLWTPRGWTPVYALNTVSGITGFLSKEKVEAEKMILAGSAYEVEEVVGTKTVKGISGFGSIFCGSAYFYTYNPTPAAINAVIRVVAMPTNTNTGFIQLAYTDNTSAPNLTVQTNVCSPSSIKDSVVLDFAAPTGVTESGQKYWDNTFSVDTGNRYLILRNYDTSVMSFAVDYIEYCHPADLTTP